MTRYNLHTEMRGAADKPETSRLDPEVAAAIRETQREHASRTHKALAGELVSQHLQRTVGAKLRGDTDRKTARAHSLVFWAVLIVLLGGLALLVLAALAGAFG